MFDIELSGYTPLSQIRSLAGSAVVLTEFTITKPDVGSADGDGLRTLKLELTTEQTRLLPGTSYYDIQLTNGDGITHTHVTGKIFKTSEVTF